MLSNEAKALVRAVDTIAAALAGKDFENAARICGGNDYNDVRKLCDGIVKVAQAIKENGGGNNGGGGSFPSDYVNQNELASALATIKSYIESELQNVETKTLGAATEYTDGAAAALNIKLVDAVTELDDAIARIIDVIPNQAAPDNQLTDKDFVNSSIQNMVAQYVTCTAEGDSQFASFAALQAGDWYHAGQPYAPSKNDYAIYLNDAHEVWRAVFDGTQWNAQYKVNDTPFTTAQLAAINSGITAALAAQITANKAALEAEKTRAEAAEDANAGAIAAETTARANKDTDLQTQVTDIKTKTNMFIQCEAYLYNTQQTAGNTSAFAIMPMIDLPVGTRIVCSGIINGYAVSAARASGSFAWNTDNCEETGQNITSVAAGYLSCTFTLRFTTKVAMKKGVGVNIGTMTTGANNGILYQEFACTCLPPSNMFTTLANLPDIVKDSWKAATGLATAARPTGNFARLNSFTPSSRTSAGYAASQYMRGTYVPMNGTNQIIDPISYEVFIELSINGSVGGNVFRKCKTKGLPAGTYYLSCVRTASYNDTYSLWADTDTGLNPSAAWWQARYEGSCGSGNTASRSIDVFPPAVDTLAPMAITGDGTNVWKFVVA